MRFIPLPKGRGLLAKSIKCKVKLKCIGYIKIGYRLERFGWYKPKVHFKYLEKYAINI